MLASKPKSEQALKEAFRGLTNLQFVAMSLVPNQV